MNVGLITIVLVFSIPLSAIILRSPLAKSLSKYIDALTQEKVMKPQIEEMKELRSEVKELRQHVNELQEINYKLEEKYNFLERLLEPPKS